jgi:hypothetical protein
MSTTKTKKIDQAVEIFKRHLPTRVSLSKKEFRAAVVADLKKELGVTNAGTLGMYFAWSDQLVSGRTAKQYNRTAPRKPKGSVKARKAAEASGEQPTDDQLNKLVNEFNKGVAEASKKKTSVTGKPAKKTTAKKSAVPKTLVATL